MGCPKEVFYGASLAPLDGVVGWMDPRREGLKQGLQQLSSEQIQRVIDYPGEMVLDEVNYQDGHFCPLAVGVGLDLTLQEPSHEKVFQALTDMGLKVYNTRGITGSFYTTNRLADLLEVAKEVLEDRYLERLRSQEDQMSEYVGICCDCGDYMPTGRQQCDNCDAGSD